MYYIIITMGVVFVVINVIIGFLIKKLGKTLLLSKYSLSSGLLEVKRQFVL